MAARPSGESCAGPTEDRRTLAVSTTRNRPVEANVGDWVFLGAAFDLRTVRWSTSSSVRIAFLLVRLSGFRLNSQRLPDGKANRSILTAIASTQKAIPLAVALRVLRLPPARLHAGRKLAEVRVLVMSGYADDQAVRRGIAQGAYPFVAKPFTADALTSAVEQALAE